MDHKQIYCGLKFHMLQVSVGHSCQKMTRLQYVIMVGKTVQCGYYNALPQCQVHSPSINRSKLSYLQLEEDFSYLDQGLIRCALKLEGFKMV